MKQKELITSQNNPLNFWSWYSIYFLSQHWSSTETKPTLVHSSWNFVHRVFCGVFSCVMIKQISTVNLRYFKNCDWNNFVICFFFKIQYTTPQKTKFKLMKQQFCNFIILYFLYPVVQWLFVCVQIILQEFLGSKYAIIAREFLEYRHKSRRTISEIKICVRKMFIGCLRINICLGHWNTPRFPGGTKEMPHC